MNATATHYQHAEVVGVYGPRLVAFLKRTDGRDRSLRVVQYSCMLLRALLGPGAPHQSMAWAVDKLTRLRSAMSATRKVLRFGREVECLLALRAQWRARRAPRPAGGSDKAPATMERRFAGVLQALAQLFDLAYYLLDHGVWFARTGLLAFAAKHEARIDLWSGYAWLGAASADALHTLLTGWGHGQPQRPKTVSWSGRRRRPRRRSRLRARIPLEIWLMLPETPTTKPAPPPALPPVRSPPQSLLDQLALARQLADVVTAAAEVHQTPLGWLRCHRVEAVTEGACGVFSSCISLATIWTAVSASRAST